MDDIQTEHHSNLERITDDLCLDSFLSACKLARSAYQQPNNSANIMMKNMLDLCIGAMFSIWNTGDPSLSNLSPFLGQHEANQAVGHFRSLATVLKGFQHGRWILIFSLKKNLAVCCRHDFPVSAEPTAKLRVSVGGWDSDLSQFVTYLTTTRIEQCVSVSICFNILLRCSCILLIWLLHCLLGHSSDRRL